MKQNDQPDPAAPYLERLKEGKVKVTPNRLKVLGRFLGADKPWTLRSLHRSLSQAAKCEMSSIYRALEALRDAGLLEEFRLPGERQTYYSLIKLQPLHRARHPHHQEHHHHIVCQDCGKVSHLDICVPVGWMGKVENASGFRITEHHLEFKGVCSNCR